MDANDLIAYNAVNRLDDISIRGSSFPTRYTTRNFGSFCPRLTCESCLLSQGVDFFSPTSYPWDARQHCCTNRLADNFLRHSQGLQQIDHSPRLALDQIE